MKKQPKLAKPAKTIEDRLWRRARGQRPLGRLLDLRPVHHRIRERDADLHGVGARGRDGAHDVGPVVAEPAGHVRHEQLATPITR